MSNVQIWGIGGAGLNTLDALQKAQPNFHYFAINTDKQSLDQMTVECLLLGDGNGCNGDPNLGLQAVKKAENMVYRKLMECDTLILLAGLGGGTGSGVTPQIAKWAKEQNKRVIAMVYLPFKFEGSRRSRNAQQALALLKAYCDQCEVFDNNDGGDVILSPKAFFDKQYQMILEQVNQIVA